MQSPDNLFTLLRSANDLGLGLRDLLVLATLNTHAISEEGEQPTAAVSIPAIASDAGLSTHAVNRAIASLVGVGAVARRQFVKIKGEQALTVISTLGQQLCGTVAKAGVDPRLPRELRDWLVGESACLAYDISNAWINYTPAKPEWAEALRGGANAFLTISHFLDAREAEGREALAQAAESTAQDDADLRDGLVRIETDDGEVAFDESMLRKEKTAVRCLDLRFVRDALAKVRARRPGMVTTANVAKWVAELGYSRTLGFVSRHDAEKAERVLVSTALRSTWSRPRGLREDYYQAVAAAAHLSTTVRFPHH